jgi:cysteine-rich repeat protein
MLISAIKKYKTYILISFFLIFFLIGQGVSASEDVIIQNLSGDSYSSINTSGTTWVGQTITNVNICNISSISFKIASNYTNQNVTVNLYNAVGGSLLGTKSISFSATSGSFVNVKFTDSVSVTPYNTYYFTIVGGTPSSLYYYWSTANVYAGGNKYNTNVSIDDDIVFKVFTENTEICAECGNGVIEGTEQCDDDNVISYDGCSSGCLSEIAVCGNGFLEQYSGEQCDDGNNENYDGCSSYCGYEYTKLVNFSDNNFNEKTFESAGVFFAPFSKFISLLVGVFLALFLIAIILKKLL